LRIACKRHGKPSSAVNHRAKRRQNWPGPGPRVATMTTTLLRTMLSGWSVEAVAVVGAFVVAAATVPAGVSGAVLLLPFQVSILGTPSPAVTPTNLLYNVVATPGALWQYWRQGQHGGRLLRPLLIGTLPGVVVGSIVRVELLPGPRPFDVVIALVLLPTGGWLLVGRRPTPRDHRRRLTGATLAIIAAGVGCVGGIYGIGGGSILAPILIGSGRAPSEVAPATLASTFLTSIAGVVTFVLLATQSHGSISPDWSVGIALGVGGLCGGYAGARLQRRVPELALRRLLGVIVLAIGARYIWLAIA
jgi:uncharacterized membrane protein YfcA